MFGGFNQQKSWIFHIYVNEPQGHVGFCFFVGEWLLLATNMLENGGLIEKRVDSTMNHCLTRKAVNFEIHHFSWVNPLFLWPCSIAMLVYQRVINLIVFPSSAERRELFTAYSPNQKWGASWSIDMDLQMIGGKMMIDNSFFRSDDIWCIFEVAFSWTNPKGPKVYVYIYIRHVFLGINMSHIYIVFRNLAKLWARSTPHCGGKLGTQRRPRPIRLIQMAAPRKASLWMFFRWKCYKVPSNVDKQL